MDAMTLIANGVPMTRAELDALPDDGYRHELIDGVLVVTPSPSYEHQDLVLQLAILLSAACPAQLKVMVAPFDVTLTDDTVVVPDLLVARRTDFTRRDLPVAPLLAVEILSPSTRRIDLTLKRSRCEEAGTASYWVVDPNALTLTPWDLLDGTYVEVASITSDQTWTAEHPFPVTITPSQLRD